MTVPLTYADLDALVSERLRHPLRADTLLAELVEAHSRLDVPHDVRTRIYDAVELVGGRVDRRHEITPEEEDHVRQVCGLEPRG